MSEYISALDLFSVGIGPSSSHTVGPMRAARMFAQRLVHDGLLERTARIVTVLHGSLGATGRGHGTPAAVVAGLAGMRAETCDPDAVRDCGRLLTAPGGRLTVLDRHQIAVGPGDVELSPRTRLPAHPNGMVLTAYDAGAGVLATGTYYSVGGGFVVEDGVAPAHVATAVPLPFASAQELLAICAQRRWSMADVAWANEVALHGEQIVDDGLARIWLVMRECIAHGLAASGVLPGGLTVRRRALRVAKTLKEVDAVGSRDTSLEWLQAFAMAVGEENSAGGRVVTAPTNGAAGIVPAVGEYYVRYVRGGHDEGMKTYLLTAAAIGSLYKANASISGAEAGCQGEVGPACSMAAGGLCAVLGGTPRQVENAAEIAMEHNLGLTCDPVGGLVQVPCIERNAIAACTAVAAARMALIGDGRHLVSLDTVIETMRQTGLDMSAKYKETSMGGLAVNVIEC